jgi:hypothetical protein
LDYSTISIKEEPVTVEFGGVIGLPNDIQIHIDPHSLSDDTTIKIERKVAESTDDFGNFVALPVSDLYKIELGKKPLLKPALIEIPFIPNRIPENVSVDNLFLAYFDESTKTWIIIEGEVDSKRNIISVESNHASEWGVFSWNWDAWIALLSETLTLSITGSLRTLELIVEECNTKSQYVSILYPTVANFMKSCVLLDDVDSTHKCNFEG